MQSSPKKFNQRFTYKDYLSWTDDEERWELINGIAYDMSPARQGGIRISLDPCLYF